MKNTTSSLQFLYKCTSCHVPRAYKLTSIPRRCTALALVTSLCRHGYRIDVQNAVESVSGLEYDRILTQMQGGDAPDARRRRTKGEQAREEELLKEAAVLEDVSDEDPFCTWAEQEDEMTRREWQPLR